MSNNVQSSVEWLVEILGKYNEEMVFLYQNEIEQAKEMEVAGREMSYDEGYKEGYKRALELTKWTISNLIPPHNEQ
jgi:hypothetical protein